MTKPTPHCRISLIFAEEAPIAVILRRGPSKWVEMIKWHTQEDRFEHGQWFNGRIYSERCGLSPDGTLLVYFAAKYGTRKRNPEYSDTYTVVSKPPFFTALAMWPQGHTWGGGGKFIDNKTLRLAYAGGGYTVTPHSGKSNLYMAPIREHHPNHPPGPLNIEFNLEDYDPDKKFRDDLNACPGREWSGKDHSGRGIFVRSGVLYAIGKDGEELELNDFNADAPMEMPSPEWAQVW